MRTPPPPPCNEAIKLDAAVSGQIARLFGCLRYERPNSDMIDSLTGVDNDRQTRSPNKTTLLGFFFCAWVFCVRSMHNKLGSSPLREEVHNKACYRHVRAISFGPQFRFRAPNMPSQQRSLGDPEVAKRATAYHCSRRVKNLQEVIRRWSFQWRRADVLPGVRNPGDTATSGKYKRLTDGAC